MLELTNGAGANVIFDSVAGEITQKSLDCLALYGTLVQFGNSSGKHGVIQTSDVHSSCRNMKGFSLGTTRKHQPARLKPAAADVIELYAAGLLHMPIAKVFELSEATAAHQFIEDRNYHGKVLLKLHT